MTLQLLRIKNQNKVNNGFPKTNNPQNKRVDKNKFFLQISTIWPWFDSVSDFLLMEKKIADYFHNET